MQSEPGITLSRYDDDDEWEVEDGWWDDEDWANDDDWVDDSGAYVADDRKRFARIAIAVFIAGLIVDLAVWWFQ